ncbi:hypothetical protein M9Y10_034796 [Tritrichomonas musculus]|uniref:Mannosyltransferase n=1 Tax=Tritrichomonas musculus TaxID=1915356 RepID=A0ABR2KGS9_9EUKA
MILFSFFAFIYVFSCCFLGTEVMTFLLIHVIDLPTIIGIGSVFGILSCGWICYLLNLLFKLSFKFGLMQIILYSLSGILIQIYRPKRKFRKSYSFFCWIYSVAIPTLVLSWFFYYGLLYKESYTRGASFGDLPFHLNLIASFAVGCNSERKSVFDIVSPFYAKEKLAYPIMSNYFSAILRSCFKSSLHLALVLPSVIFGFAIYTVLSSLVFYFSKSELSCLFAPWLFLFEGGLGFIEYIIHPELRGRFYTDFVHLWGYQEGSWFQTLVHVLLPQRASLHSIPIAHSIILLLILGSEKYAVDLKLYSAIGLLIITLPQTQPHSIIAVAEYGICHFIIKLFPFKIKRLKIMIINYGTLAAIAIILGAPQCIPLIGRTTAKNFMKVDPIWKMDKTRKFFGMWYRSLGTLFAMSVIHAPSIMNWNQITMYLPSVCVFIISNFIWYQPWHLDNTKVFNAAWMPLVLAGVSNYLSRLFKAGKIGKVLCLLLMISSCFSGFLGVQMTYREVYQVWNWSDYPMEVADFVIQNTEPKSIFVTDEWHAHPIMTLAGRQTVLGYPGWLVSHGLDGGKRSQMIQNLIYFPDNTETSDAFGVDYICARGRGSSSLHFHPRDSNKWKRIFSMGEYKIFKRDRNATA